MIEDPPLLTISRQFERPSPATLESLRGVPTGFLVDSMGGRGALDAAIKPIDDKHASFVGTVVTCHCGPADNLAVFGALQISQAGDVIVIGTDAFLTTAVIGDLVLGMGKNRGLAAMVTDGMVRDLVGIRDVGLPCFAAGITPNSPARNGPGSAGLPITLGGATIRSGDVIAGDLDGAVVIPGHLLDQVLEDLPALKEKEAELDAKVKAGLEIPEFVSDFLASDQVRWLD